MNGNLFQYDMPPDRSPTAQRNNTNMNMNMSNMSSNTTLQRQSSRNQFDQPYGSHPTTGLYTAEDHARYDGNRYIPARSSTIAGYTGQPYAMTGAEVPWNPTTFTAPHASVNGMGPPALRKTPTRGGAGPGRSVLPPVRIPGLPTRSRTPQADHNAAAQTWIDTSHTMPLAAGMGPGQMTNLGPHNHNHGQPMRGPDPVNGEVEEELIFTAIVIKNIPFAIRKEQLCQIMTEMGLPLPYAFNYHFDNGIFRGLAFANFNNPEETSIVIDTLNHFELNGRKLRVEYKKMLPQHVRDRIEREKRERRGQLEEQHRPVAPVTLQPQISASSLSSRIMANSPSPLSGRTIQPGNSFSPAVGGDPQCSPGLGSDVDLNEPQALKFYSDILLFKEDAARKVLVFPATLSPAERRIVHTLAHHMDLGHASQGEADRRAVHVSKDGPRARVSPPRPHMSGLRHDDRRALNRAATTDFSDVRGSNGNYPTAMRHQGSGHLGYSDPTSGLGLGNHLRTAKSFADLRSYTPSPVPSTASYPAALRNNVVGNMQDFGRDQVTTAQTTSTTAMLTPSTSLTERGDTALINGLGSMTLGSTGSPRGLRGIASWDRVDAPASAGPIGPPRSFNTAATTYDDRTPTRLPSSARDRVSASAGGYPSRRANGHTTHGSDESQHSNAPEHSHAQQ